MIEDEDARPAPRRIAALALDAMGLSELTGYVEELRAEIARKASHRAAAAAAFFKPGP